MTDAGQRAPRPRLVADRPFPPYRHLPGDTPHPTRDPGGHSYANRPEVPEPPEPPHWRACGTYLYGIDLFNHGYYWEAHEAWEGLWHARARRGPTAIFLKALIALAAAGLKIRLGNLRGTKAHAARAADLFHATAAAIRAQGTRYMGLDLPMLERRARDIASRPPAGPGDETASGPIVFEFVLWPE